MPVLLNEIIVPVEGSEDENDFREGDLIEFWCSLCKQTIKPDPPTWKPNPHTLDVCLQRIHYGVAIK